MVRIAASFIPPIALNRRSRVPLNLQISEWFRQAIADGRLHPGQRIPSTRHLARELGVSRIPVLTAYEQLLAEGYIESFRGAGTAVASTIPRPPVQHRRVPSHRNAASRESRLAPRLSRRAARVVAPEQMWLKNLGAFRVGLPALDQFPSKIWSRLVSRHARRHAKALLAYGDALGHLPLRRAVAQYLSVFRGVRCEASQILITTGSQQGLYLAAQALLDPMDRVWVEDPVYPGTRQALTLAGADLVPVPVDAEGLDVVAAMRQGSDARVAYVAPAHQFPLGVTMSAARRMQLLEWAEQHDGWIVEDDYDSEFRFGGQPVGALQSLGTISRVLYIGTFSKVMFPALRLGYLVLPAPLVPVFAALRDAIDTFSATLHQAVMADFIAEGHFARHIRRMRALYAERRTILVEALRRRLGATLEVIGAEAGMQLTALLPPGVSDIEVSRRAANAGISARPLSLCYARPPVRGGLILGFGGATAAELRDGVRRLAGCL